MSTEGLTHRSSSDMRVNYASSRSRSDRSKRERRTSRSSRTPRSSHSKGLNGSNSSLNMSFSDREHLDLSTPDLYSNVIQSTNNRRASVSPALYDNSSSGSTAYDFGGTYVRPAAPAPAPAPADPERDSLLQSANADPNDPLMGMGGVETFQDEFEDEMDEIEMDKRSNFINLGELEAKARAQKRRRRCRFRVCMLILLIAIVGTVLAITASKKSAKAKTPQIVPEANKILRLWCAEEFDKGPGEAVVYPLVPTEDCIRGCAPAECCWNPHGDYVCTPETEQFCAGYKTPCKLLAPHSDETQVPHMTSDEIVSAAPGVDFPTAPPTLKTVCVPEGPSFTASLACQHVCSLADCCWNATSTAHCTAEIKAAKCGPYQEFCSFMNERSPFPHASPQLASICAVDSVRQNGPEKCQQECGAAECCWKVGTVNCAGTVPSGLCNNYTSHCSILNSLDSLSSTNNNNGGSTGSPSSGTTTNAPFPPAPDGLVVYCDPSQMEEISLHVCQDKCEAAACCWSTNSDVCDSSVSNLCPPYVQACAILNDLATYNGGDGLAAQVEAQADDPVPAPPGDFNTRCSKENIIGSNNGGDLLIECERDCLAAACCWEPNIDACIESSHCSAYAEHCSVFVGLFEESTATTTSNNNNNNNAGSTGSSGSSGSAPSIPIPPSNLDTICGPDTLAIGIASRTSIMECESECVKAACCWKEVLDNSCSGAADCAPYMEPCATNLVSALHALENSVSVTGAQDSEAAKTIASACDSHVAIFVKAKCQNACHPGDCCFDDSVACEATVDCSIYDPCEILFRRLSLRH